MLTDEQALEWEDIRLYIWAVNHGRKRRGSLIRWTDITENK